MDPLRGSRSTDWSDSRGCWGRDGRDARPLHLARKHGDLAELHLPWPRAHGLDAAQLDPPVGGVQWARGGRVDRSPVRMHLLGPVFPVRQPDPAAAIGDVLQLADVIVHFVDRDSLRCGDPVADPRPIGHATGEPSPQGAARRPDTAGTRERRWGWCVSLVERQRERSWPARRRWARPGRKTGSGRVRRQQTTTARRCDHDRFVHVAGGIRRCDGAQSRNRETREHREHQDVTCSLLVP